jgi:hypothetical protein
MTQSQRNRVARLEGHIRVLAKRAAELKTDDGSDEDGYLHPRYFDMALSHAVNLAYLIKFGDPKIGEPLSEAWKRTGYQGEYGPFLDFRDAKRVCDDIRASVFPGLPGANLKEKLDLIFGTAPAWLIWFAGGESSAFMLDLKLPPDFLDAVNFDRPSWRPCLPTGAFEPRLRPEHEKPDSQLEEYYLRMAGPMDSRTTRRQRRLSTPQPSPPARLPVHWPDA